MTPTKEELTAARDDLQSGGLTHDDELIINALLDNAINDVELQESSDKFWEKIKTDFPDALEEGRKQLTEISKRKSNTNALDLESLKREVINSVQSIRHNELSIDAGSAISEAIDHLAPRIVREGMVQIPQEAMKLIDRMAEQWSTDECVEQGKEDECDFTDGYDMFVRDARKLKAMIAAAKEE